MTAVAVGGLILGGGVGSVLGYFVGRTRAEWGRGRRDASAAFANRKGYRRR